MRVKEEDRIILETTLPDFPLDVTSEVHLRCDAATLAYRRSMSTMHHARSATAEGTTEEEDAWV